MAHYLRCRWALAGLAAALMLGGCALAPQTVTLSPAIDIEEAEHGQGREVALRVVDRRERDLIGYRDADDPRSEITAEDVTGAIDAGMREALRRQGFVPVGWDEAAERRLTVVVDRIDYERVSGFPSHEIRLVAELSGRGEVAGQRYEASARARSSEQMVTSPSAAQNEEMINELVSRALNRLSSDRSLLELLTR